MRRIQMMTIIMLKIRPARRSLRSGLAGSEIILLSLALIKVKDINKVTFGLNLMPLS